MTRSFSNKCRASAAWDGRFGTRSHRRRELPRCMDMPLYIMSIAAEVIVLSQVRRSRRSRTMRAINTKCPPE